MTDRPPAPPKPPRSRQTTSRKHQTEDQRRFRAVWEAAADAMALSDPEGIVLDANPAYFQLYGYGPETVIGKSFALIFPADQRQAALEQYRATFTSPTIPSAFERTVQRADGSMRVVESRIDFLTVDGQRTAMLSTIRDITERKQAEQRQQFLIEASYRLASSIEYEPTLEHVAHLAVPFLADWCVIHVLTAEQSILERMQFPVVVAHQDAAKEALAYELWRRYPPDPEAPHGLSHVLRSGQSELMSTIPPELIERAAQDAEHLRILRELQLRSSMIVPLIARGQTLGSITLIAAESGRQYEPADLVVAEDLAQRCALAIDNARLYQQAQQAIRHRDVFLAVASHELRTPLTSLKMQMELLRRHFQSGPLSLAPERLARLIEIGNQQTQQLERLIDTLFDVSRITSGRLELERQAADLASIVRTVVERSRDEAEAMGSTLSLQAQAPIVGYWDPFRLEQMVTNLVINAIKYGSGNPIEVTVTQEDATARLGVRDQGIGIPPDRLTKIFEQFERAVPDRSYGGLGLGLYITREIVEMHGGTLEVESTPDQGSTFTVKLPVS